MCGVPEEILIEILFRLPAKSLSKFKTACKSWYSIINNKQFVKRQLNHARSTLYDQHKDFLGILRIPSSDGSTRCLLYDQNWDDIIYAKEFDLPFKIKEVCNYCDGLICFTLSNNDILIWNPSLPMDQSKIIPMEYNTESDQFLVYDSTTDDYKIVGVPKHRRNANSRDSFVKVFSLRSRSWIEKKILKNFTYLICENKSFYTQNRLHWVGKYYDDRGREIQSILYFDMVEERLDHLVNLPCRFVEMFNYKDTLAIIDLIDFKTLWVLEEYVNGMKSSWIKFELPKFKYFDIKGKMGTDFFYRCFTRDRKVLIESAGDRGLRASPMGYNRESIIPHFIIFSHWREYNKV